MLLGKRWSLWKHLAAMIVGAVVVAGALSACELSVPNVGYRRKRGALDGVSWV